MKINTTIQWAIYARKSSESEDRQIQSTDDQINFLNTLAKREGLSVKMTISEAKSAKSPHVREGFKKLLNYIENGEINGVLCWKLDRLSRNPIDSGAIQWHLQNGKIVAIKTFDRVYSSEDNALVFAVEQGMDNQYVRDLSKNVKRGLYAKAEKGWFPCIPPVGYINSKYRDKGREKILVDKKRFNLVRKMFDLVLSGTYSPQAALKIATEDWKLDIAVHRRKAGAKAIDASSVYRMLANIFYAGYFKYGGKIYKGGHTPMLTMREFENLQTIIKKKDHSRAYTHSFPFTGIMKCARCGGSITASEKFKIVQSTGLRKSYIYYHCSRRVVGHTNCSNPSMPNAQMESQIENYLNRIMIGEDYYRLGIETLQSNSGDEARLRENILEKQMAHVAEIERKIDRLVSFLLNETISEKLYKSQKLELEKNLAISKEKLNQIDSEIGDYTKFVLDGFTFCRYAMHAMKNGDLQTRKSLLLSLGSNHRINDKNLYLDTFGWLSAIKEGEKTISSQNARFELESACNDNGGLEELQVFRPMCAIIKNVNRELSKVTTPFIADLSEWVKHLPPQPP